MARAHTLAEARAQLAATPYDVVIAALHLPDATAVDLVDADGGKSRFPAVVLAQPGEEPLAARAVESGAICA